MWMWEDVVKIKDLDVDVTGSDKNQGFGCNSGWKLRFGCVKGACSKKLGCGRM